MTNVPREGEVLVSKLEKRQKGDEKRKGGRKGRGRKRKEKARHGKSRQGKTRNA